MTSQKRKHVKWKIEFVSFKCRHCSAPFQLPQELVNHKKKYHAKEMQRYPGVRRQRERFGRSRSAVEVQNSPSPRRNAAYSRVIQGSSGATPTSFHVKQEPRWFYGNNEHRCAECNVACMTEKSLKEHRERQHNPARAFPCSWCDSSFADPGPRQNHVMLHENRMRDGTDFPCGHCDKRFLSAYSAENHRLNDHQATSSLHHREQSTEQRDAQTQQSINKLIKKINIGPVTRYSCAKCNKNFRERSVAVDHAYIHIEDHPHQCSSCEAQFSTQGALETHMEECHAGQGPSVKIKKEKISPQKTATRTASRRKSTKRPNYVENSDESEDDSEQSVPSLSGPFARALLPPNKIKAEKVSPGDQKKQAKKLPNRSVHFQNEICELCDETLDSGTMLFHYRQHAKLQSLGSDFPCEQCTFRFLKLSQLKAHVAEQHRMDTEDPRFDDAQNGQILNSEDSNEDMELSEEQHAMLTRPAECVECGIEFETNYDLIDHKKDPACKDRWKSYIRISACQTCDFVSIRPTELVVHTQLHRSHEEENLDFPCPSCPKRYLTKLLLNSHEQTCHGAASSPMEDDAGNEDHLSNPDFEDNESNGNRSLECSLTSAGSEEDAEESFSDEERNDQEVHLSNRTIKPINLKGVNTEAVSKANEGHDVIGFFFCDICDYKCIWKETFEKHQTEHRMAQIHEEDFPCPYCPKRFLEPLEIQDHAKKCTAAATQVCRTSSPDTSTGGTRKDLTVKRKYVTNRTRCRTCNKTFSTMLQLYEHKISECVSTRKCNSELEYFKCQTCEYTCIWKIQRRKHVCEHSESQSAEVLQPPDTPEKVLQEGSSLVTEDREELPDKCNSCPAVFLSPKDLFQHKVSQKCHEDSDELSKLCYFECHECGYTCIWKSQQDEHRLLHPSRSKNKPESSCPESTTRASAEKEVENLEKDQTQQQTSETAAPGDAVVQLEGSEKCITTATDINSDVAMNKYTLPPAFKANTMRYQQPDTPSLYRRASAELSNGFDEDLNEPACPTPTTPVCQEQSEDLIDISKLDGPYDVPNVPHTCHTCKTEFPNIVHLVKHRRSVHPSNIDYDYGVFPCTHCDDLIQWKVGWRNHIETHRKLRACNRDYPCPTCPKRFVRLQSRNLHISRYHSDIDQLRTSPVCNPTQIENAETHENHSISAQATSSKPDDEITKSRGSKNKEHVFRGYKIPYRKMGPTRGAGFGTKSNASKSSVFRGYKISSIHLGRGKLNPSLKSVNSAKKHLLNRSRVTMTQASNTSTGEAPEGMIASSESPVPPEICTYCGYSTLDADFMIQHIATHSDKIQQTFDFPCDKCPSRFSEESEHSKHQEEFHAKNDRVYLSHSLDLPANENPVETNSNHTKSNELQQVGNKFPCASCQVHFGSLRDLAQHHKQVHGGQTGAAKAVSVCGYCGYQTTWKQSYRKHMATHAKHMKNHTDFPCLTCNKRFFTDKQRYDHRNRCQPIESAEERLLVNIHYESEEVGNIVQNSEQVLPPDALSNNIQNLPVGVNTQLPAENVSFESQSISTTSYACSCGKNFEDFDALKLHVEHDHNEGSTDLELQKATVDEGPQSNQQIIVTDVRTEEETTYNLTCADCGGSFTDELSLDTHLMLHQTGKDGNSDYPCSSCHLRFDEKVSLETHTIQCHPKSTVIDNNQFFQACASLSNERINGQIPVIKQDHSAQSAQQPRSPRKTRSMKRNENGQSEEYVCAKCNKSFNTLPDYFTHRQICYNLPNADVSSSQDTDTHEKPLEAQDIKVPVQKFSNGQTEAEAINGFKRSSDVICLKEEDLYSRVKNRRRAASILNTNPHGSSSAESLASNHDISCTLKK